MPRPKHAWMVRAGTQNELADQIEEQQAVAIGWSELGDLSNLQTREEFKQRYRETFPEASPPTVSINAGQVYRFFREIHEGDYILTFFKASREILIGLATGEAEYKPETFEDYPNIRHVELKKKVSRDQFGPAARNTLGGTLTVFQLDNILPEIHRVMTATDEVPVITEAEEDTPPFFKEVQAKADELIADLISKLDPYDFQDLVAAVLRAMGFKATSVPPGPDRGIDIMAYRDPFGFEPPRIKVQVKHRTSSTGGPDMRSFVAALNRGEKGLYVSTGGFTRDAKLDAERAYETVTLLDRDGFIQLLLDNYETLEPEYKAMVPLRKVWLPTE